MNEDNKGVALRFAEAIGGGDPDGLRDALHEDATWWIPGTIPVSGTWKGHDEIFNGMFAKAGAALEMDSIELDVLNSIAEGDTVVLEWRVRARTVAGRDYDNRYSMVLELRDGKIAAVREYTDMLNARDTMFPEEGG